VPCHHIYGFLFTVLLPRHSGIAEDDVIDARASSASAIAHRLRAGDLVVGHPEFWRAFVRSGARAPEGVAGTTSTAPCPDALADEVHDAGIAPLLQVYGASETAGLAWRGAAARPFDLMPFWRRDGSDLIRTAADGSERRVTAPDRLSWIGEREFHVLERTDGAVQVGGTNVFPAHVRAVLLQHPEVHDAAVRLMRPDEGTRLKAFVVPRDGRAGPELERSLRAWIDSRLSPAERPRALRFGPSLPVSETGKSADWRLEA
jgi:4-coumarate--CoA ligase (photoactive yellow protein activation family)